jgi:hypothetical protein
MSIFNVIINAVFDGYFNLAGMLGGDFALWLFSAAAGVLFLYIFKLTSNQEGIRKTKDKIAAGFLEVRLFKDDLGQMMSAQGLIFRSAFRYMSHALKPMLFMMVPVLLMMIQLNVWYGYEPFQIEDTALVQVNFAGDANIADHTISLVAEEGLEVQTPTLRIASLNEANWRIKALADGQHKLTLNVDGKELVHTIYVGENKTFHKIEPVMVRGAWDELWNPGLAPITTEMPIVQFSIEYKEADVSLLGWEVHWVIAFMILSMIFGFALKGVLGVEI